MDRLSLVTAALGLGLAACEAGPAGDAPRPPSRVDAVVGAAPAKVPTAAEFCDVSGDPTTARTFAFPELAEPAPSAGGGWRWINLWATWCGPCVAEMPMLESWHERLRKGGHAVDLVFLSVDEDVAALEAFRAKNGRGAGPRTKSLSVLEPWLVSQGLDASAAIPINLWVDAGSKSRCVRTGALEEHHYAAVEALLR